MEEPQGWKNLVLLCRDPEAKIYFLDRLQSMTPAQKQIDYAAQLMIEMAAALNALAIHRPTPSDGMESIPTYDEAITHHNKRVQEAFRVLKKFKEWK